MDCCETCGTPLVEDAADPLMATAFLDTVQLEPLPGEIELEDERIVRPSLAILFRMAVGPAADYYAPRFLEYERVGRSFPSWNWAAPWFPTVWAFYHKLWVAGLLFALWPVAAMSANDTPISTAGALTRSLWRRPPITWNPRARW